jgi:HNH endonuclease
VVNQAKDLNGKLFGKLLVLARAGSSSDGSSLWLCRCTCGRQRKIIAWKLRTGRAQSCQRCSRKNSWTPALEEQLQKLYPLTPTHELAALFKWTPKAIASRAKILGVKRDRPNYRKWTSEEDRVLREQYPHRPTQELAADLGRACFVVYRRAAKLGLKKTPEYMASPAACRLRRGDNVGKAYRYPKGHQPANKGTRRPGWAPGKMASTQFKKGQVSANTMPMWSFRWVDGYVMLKTGKQHAPPNTGWEYVHRLIWEQANGPLPDWREARLWWKDGDHTNNSLSNLELVTAQEHMKRTTIHNLPPQLREVIQLTGALKRKIRNRKKEELSAEKHDERSAQSPVRGA